MTETDYHKQAEGKSYEERVTAWLIQCFSTEIAQDKAQRANRFGEEAIELYQACGGTKEGMLELVHYVYGRPQGEAFQEVGGVLLTLAGLCTANSIPMLQAGETELKRVWGKIPEIKAKEASRVNGSVLPGVTNNESQDIRLLTENILADFGYFPFVDFRELKVFKKENNGIDLEGNYYFWMDANTRITVKQNVFTVKALLYTESQNQWQLKQS